MRDEQVDGSPTAGLEIVRRTSSKHEGVCCLVPEHWIKKGESIVLVMPEGADETTGFALLGWACRNCQDRIVRGV